MADFIIEIKTFVNECCPNPNEFLTLLSSHEVDLGRIILEDCHHLMFLYAEPSPENGKRFKSANQFLLDYCWEKLHSGYWQRVNQCWRILYAFLRIIDVLFTMNQLISTSNQIRNDNLELSLLLSQIPELISNLDYSLIMGVPVFDNLASKLAHKLHVLWTNHSDHWPNEYLDVLRAPNQMSRHMLLDKPNLDTIQISQLMKLKTLDKIRCPSLEKFSELMQLGKPFIVTDSINFWPSVCKTSQSCWTLDYWFKHFGFRLVPVEIGSKYTESNWGQELITIGQFIKTFILDDNSEQVKGYLAQHQLFLQIPELGQDLYTPDYCMLHGSSGDDDQIDINIWFGPSNTISPLHHDGVRANLLSQIQGYKYVVLYPASETPYLYPYKEQMLKNTSMLDIEHPDFEEFPKLVEASGFRGILGPGEMLYIPPQCWHYVRALSISFSVNFWWNVTHDLIPFHDF